MINRARAIRLALTGIVLLGTGVVVVQRVAAQRRGVAPIPLELDAYVATAPQGVQPDYTWVVAHRAQRYTLLVTRLLVRNTRASAMGLNAAVEPYAVAFTLAGTRAAIEALTAAAPSRLLTLRGQVRISGGARYLMLDSVTPVPSDVPEP